MTTNWNIADVFEAVAARVPERPCQIHGERVVTWADFDARADALAADLVAAGLTKQSKVACYLYNGVEYMEIMVAAFKAAMAPVNTNYRYGPEEIFYLFDNADAEAVVFHASFTELLEGIRERLTTVKRWYVVADASGAGPAWATPYEDVVTSGATLELTEWARDADDLLLLYTGGTTGMPKGVMWRQDDLFNVLGAGGSPLMGTGPAEDVDEVAARAAASDDPPVMVVACPLMHGTGQFSALITMIGGGAVVSLADRSFSVEQLFATVEARRATNVVIVGQAFAGPMLEFLDANPEAYDLSSIKVISSSGVMWSHDNKQGLLEHLPQA
ncbi:MAG: AMP-binding protein, partial [Ilumatobacteraceae bacterium]